MEPLAALPTQEPEAVNAHVPAMEEAEKLKQLQGEVAPQIGSGSSEVLQLEQLNLNDPSSNGEGAGTLANSGQFYPSLSMEEKIEMDRRSIYVGNVDYGTSAEELGSHFKTCGNINRVTIPLNRSVGYPRGFAYIEFATLDSVPKAMMLDQSFFRGRLLKVMIKRTNQPGLRYTTRPPLLELPRGGPAASRGGVMMRAGFQMDMGFVSQNFTAPKIFSPSTGMMMPSAQNFSNNSPY